jgi:hypothetical protein
MKIKDFYSLLFLVLLFLFFLFPVTRSFYKASYDFSPEILSFFKFALLATFGEMAGSRIKTGNYIPSDFGLFPKTIIWGFWGVAISIAFRIFAGGVSLFPLFQNISTSFMILFKAFTVSFFMNIFFAPIMMLGHRVTDLHISEEGGRFSFSNFNTASLLKTLDWDLFWGFLMKKTIPLFWIPVHTITFLLPEEFRVLFAALLSIFLGVFLSLSSNRTKG